MYLCIGISPFLSGRDIQRGRPWISLHFIFARVGQLFDTLIRHAAGFCTAPIAVVLLSITVIFAAKLALLVPFVRGSRKPTLGRRSALLRAVFLASIVRAAHKEDRAAGAAGELVERNLDIHRERRWQRTGLVRCFRSL